MNDYYKVSEAENYVFYKVPKALFTEDKYYSVSTDTKMLYGLLLDRMHLSVKNGWADKSRRVYQFFTVKEQLMKSIQAQGTIEPLIVRPLSESEYEVISGHRRMEICRELGIEKIPVIVRNLTDEQAISMMVDANLHRENILPSECAFAYKMKLEAISRQGQRTDLTSSQIATKCRSDDLVAKDFGIGKDTLHRYIRLTYLIPELLSMVDEGRIALTPAVELSYLTEQEQQALLNEIEYADATPSLSQAQKLKEFSKQGRLNTDIIYAVMSEEKANQKERIKTQVDQIRKYFPNGYTMAQMEETIIKLCEAYHKKHMRDRDSR